jgi:membrane-bound lytic murein transglycosylase B
MGGATRRIVVAGLLAALAGVALIGCGGAAASSPESVAGQLGQTDAALRAAIDGWRSGGDPPATKPPQEVFDQAEAVEGDSLYLARHPNLTARVLPLLSPALRAETRRLIAAKRDLLRLSSGGGRKLKEAEPASLADLVTFYRQAQARYGVAWNYLAAINLVETKFGRVRSDSVAGAKGPMQFIPSTWQIYGNGGDIHDPHDAILAAANLLHHNGAPPRYARALRAYNDSGLYVDAVTRYAREISANPYGIYYLYCWRP